MLLGRFQAEHLSGSDSLRHKKQCFSQPLNFFSECLVVGLFRTFNIQLPPALEDKFGRLVGVTELEKGPASKTKLDVPPGFRNDVLRGKQVIIGCGGGFHQECTQPYSLFFLNYAALVITTVAVT